MIDLSCWLLASWLGSTSPTQPSAPDTLVSTKGMSIVSGDTLTIVATRPDLRKAGRLTRVVYLVTPDSVVRLRENLRERVPEDLGKYLRILVEEVRFSKRFSP